VCASVLVNRHRSTASGCGMQSCWPAEAQADLARKYWLAWCKQH